MTSKDFEAAMTGLLQHYSIHAGAGPKAGAARTKVLKMYDDLQRRVEFLEARLGSGDVMPFVETDSLEQPNPNKAVPTITTDSTEAHHEQD